MPAIKISCSTKFLLSIDQLNYFQGDLKDISEDGLRKLKTEILTTGFAFAPHVWRNPKNRKWYLLDGHQRIKAVRVLIEEGYTIAKIPIVPVQAKTIEEARHRVLQATSQYGKITNQGLANFAIEANLGIQDIAERFDLPELDLGKFEDLFSNDGKIVSIAAHERVVGAVNSGDENSEWVSMPGFEPGKKEYKLILIFGSEADRKKFCEKKEIEVKNVNNGQWTSRL